MTPYEESGTLPTWPTVVANATGRAERALARADWEGQGDD
jgi:hypothetical protein